MTAESAKVQVIKQDLDGNETWRYTGKVLERDDHSILIEARFNRPDTPFHGLTLGEGDRFVERYYSDRWYNIFEMHSREDDALKGWYCNVSFPAEITESEVCYRDLALDLLVFPDSRTLVLDRDEFVALPLSPEIRQQAEQALVELIAQFANTQCLATAGSDHHIGRAAPRPARSSSTGPGSPRLR